MRVRFHDPLERVTGSCYELYRAETDTRFLVDCGMRQGEPGADERNRAPLPFDAASLDFVVLTHAHLDHCGLIPRLYLEGFSGTIYATRETRALAEVVLKDAARQAGAPYRVRDLKKLKWHEPNRAVFGVHCPVGPDLFLRFFRSGHILGACSVAVVWGPIPRPGGQQQRSILFSGDLGPQSDGEICTPMTRFRMHPMQADYAVVESTYGATVRPAEQLNAEARLKRLDAELRAALFERGGPVIVPCFAIGRTQDLLFELHVLFSRHPDIYGAIPVFFDAPMASRVNRVYAKHLGRVARHRDPSKDRLAWLGKGAFEMLGLEPNRPYTESLMRDALREMLLPDHEPAIERDGQLQSWRRIWTPGAPADPTAPGIIVTGGGMCDGGRVQGHLASVLRDQQATILLTGYATPTTVAGRLLQLSGRSPEERTRVSGPVGLDVGDLPLSEVGAHVTALTGYSAHADQSGLLEWLFPPVGGCGPREPAAPRVFITHGGCSQRRALEAAIVARAAQLGHRVEVELPTFDHGCFDLNHGCWDAEERTEAQILRARVAELERSLAAAKASNTG